MYVCKHDECIYSYVYACMHIYVHIWLKKSKKRLCYQKKLLEGSFLQHGFFAFTL